VIQRKRRSKLRLALFIVAALFAVVFGVAAAKGWQVIDAIRTSENNSVVALPPRDPTIEAQLAQTQARLNQGKSIATPAASASASPAAGAATPAAGGASPIADNATPVSQGVASTVAANPSPTSALSDSASGQSNFDVVKELISAGVNGGDPSTSSVWNGRTDINILVAGVDRRPQGGDQNSDVIILVHVDLINKRVAAISIPRDLWVDIPGVGQDKINSAYNYGIKATPDDPAAGIAKLRDTVETLFGVPVDGYVLFDFNGFKTVVDELGGVDINVPYKIVDDQYPTEDYGVKTVTFEAGEQHMDGETALEYVRTRHADSDDCRRGRQMQVMMALFGNGKSLSSIAKIQPLILALGKTIQTSFPLDQQLTLARLGLEMNQDEIRYTVLGADLLTGGPLYDGGPWVYSGDMTQIAAFVQNSLSTDPADYATPVAAP
jgi:LCP family protein required for cell wall assembly